MPLPAGHFTLKTASDLFEKLKHDFNRLWNNPTDSFACFDFFVTAEHLPEWHFGPNSTNAATLRRTVPVLKLCSHLANGAKHFEAKDKSILSVERTAVSSYTILNIPQPHEPTPPSAVKAETLGNAITVRDLASRVCQYWANELGQSWDCPRSTGPATPASSGTPE